MVTAEQIENWIKAELPNSQVTVQGDDGRHFNALVISQAFDGKNTIQRHRLVYAALGERMQSDIHALSLRTLTEQEAR